MIRKFLLSCLFVGFFSLSTTAGQTPPQASQTTLYQSAHYEVDAASSLPGSLVESIVHNLEANYSLFSELFTSASQRPETLLRVKIYADRDSFNQALASQRVYNRNNYIYLYYADPERNVLMIYPIEKENEERAQLARHSFFSYAFDSSPTLPAWLREGLALYYESLIYEENGTPVVPYNHLYMDDLKKAAAETPANIKELMMLTDGEGKFEKEQFERNLLYSWGIVNYFMFSDNEGDRSIIEQAVALTSKDNTQEDNSTAVMEFIFSRKPDFEADFANFLNSKMGYVETLEAMRTAYAEKNFDLAKSYAESASRSNPDAYLPVYYLGLTAFEQKSYQEAKDWYTKALNLGAPKALIDFVMGYVYYYGDRNYSEAEASFQRAKSEDAVRYGQKVDSLLRALRQDSQSPYGSAPVNSAVPEAVPVENSSKEENLSDSVQP